MSARRRDTLNPASQTPLGWSVVAVVAAIALERAHLGMVLEVEPAGNPRKSGRSCSTSASRSVLVKQWLVRPALGSEAMRAMAAGELAGLGSTTMR